MLDTAVVNDIKTVDVDVTEFIVSDRLGYITELYKQISQLDFSKPVLEALLNYQEPVPIDISAAAKLNKISKYAGIDVSKSIETLSTYKPTRTYTKEVFIKALMDAYNDQLYSPNISMSRIMKGITYRTASLMYNFMSLQMVTAPVNLLYYIKQTGTECSVVSTAAELKARNIFSSIDTSNFHNEYEDTVIDLCSEEFERYIMNDIVSLSQHIDTKIVAHPTMSSDEIVQIVTDLHKYFIEITSRECDYIILNKRMYARLAYTSKSAVPMVFGKPVFGNGENNAVTFGINPNISSDYVSGFPILMTNTLVNSQSVINPTTFSPTLWVTSRHTIAPVGNLHKAIITFKCWDK